MSSQQLPNVDDIINQYKSPESSSFTRRLLGDTAVSAAKGVTNLGQSVVGLADIPTGGYAGKLLEDYTPYSAERTNQFLDELYTPEQQAANREVQNADGFNEALGAALANPSTIGHGVVESLPLMLGGQAIAKGILTKAGAALSPLAAGAIGEGTVTAGSQAEQIRQQTEDRLLTPEQAAIAAGSGVATGGISALSGGIAKQLGIADIDTALLGGQAGKGNMARRFIQSGLTEGVLEEAPQSAQEQMATNIALDKPAMEGVGSATAQGGLLGFAQGGVTGAVFGHGQQAQPTPTPGQTALPPANNTAALPPSPATTQTPAGALSRAVNQGGLTTAQNTDPLALPNLPADELLTFADGSQARASEALAQLASVGYDAQQAQAIVNNLIARQKPAAQPQDTSVQSTGRPDLASYQASQKQAQADMVPANQYARQNFINGLFQDNQQPAQEGLTQEKLPNDLVAEHKNRQETQARQGRIEAYKAQSAVFKNGNELFSGRHEAISFARQNGLDKTHTPTQAWDGAWVLRNNNYKGVINAYNINELLNGSQPATASPAIAPGNANGSVNPDLSAGEPTGTTATVGTGRTASTAKPARTTTVENRQQYHPAVISMANDLSVGGGVSTITDKGGNVIRTPSTNPDWFKNGFAVTNSKTGNLYSGHISVREIQEATGRLEKGEPLTGKQQDILTTLSSIASDMEQENNQQPQQPQEAKNGQETTTKTQVLANAAGEAQARPAAKNWDELKLREKEDISDKRVNQLSPEQIKQVSDVLLIRPDVEGNYSLDKIKREHPDDIKFAVEQSGITWSANDTNQGLDSGEYDDSIPFSINQNKPVNTYSKASLTTTLRTQLDKVYGQGWFKRLMATGKFQIIDRAEAKALGANPNAQAFFNPKDDTTYFVADNIDTRANLARLMLHEIGVHALQLGKASPEFQAILKQVENLTKQPRPSKAIQDAIKAAKDANTPAHLMNEEIAGYLVENHPELNVVQKIMAWFRAQLRKLGINTPMTDADIVAMATAALRSAPDTLVFDGDVTGDVKLSQGERLAPNGKPSNLNAMQYAQVRTPEFKAWFGDWENDPENASKVVDENGEPLVVYHGTMNDFYSFDRSKLGSYTHAKSAEKGFFFTDSPQTAASYTINGAEYNDEEQQYYNNLVNGLTEKELNIVNSYKEPWNNSLRKIHSEINKLNEKLQERLEKELSDLQDAIEERQESAYKKGDIKPFWKWQKETSDGKYYSSLLDDVIFLKKREGKFSNNANIIPVFLNLKSPKTKDFNGKHYRDESYASILDNAINDGKDSAILKNTFDEGIFLSGEKMNVYIAFNPNQIKSATGNTGAFSPENDDIRYSFAGENAKTADKYQLSNAQERLANGEDAEQVRKDTGWFKGVDGKWRFEIDDSDIEILPIKPLGKTKLAEKYLIETKGRTEKFPIGDPRVPQELQNEALDWANKNPEIMPLAKIIDADKLFSAYPQLKNIGVMFGHGDIKSNGHYDYKSNIINLNDKYLTKDSNSFSTLLHEIQHAIQNQEGFAKGGSQSQFNHDELLKEANDAFNHIEYVLMPSLFDEYKQSNDQARKEEILQQRRELTALKNQLKKKTPEELSFDKYRRLAGEIEARNTQARLNLTAEQRRNTPPSQTQDIPDSEAIVVWNGTEMHSTLPLNAGNGIRYSFAQAATDYFTGAPRRATTLNDIDTMINTGKQPADKIGWQYYFDKAVTAFTDSTRPFARFVQDTFDSEQASKLLSGADRAHGMKAAYEKEAMNKFGRPIADGIRDIMKHVKPSIKGYVSDSELYKTAKYLAGMWMTARYAIDANDWLMQKDQQDIDDLEQQKADAMTAFNKIKNPSFDTRAKLDETIDSLDKQIATSKKDQAKRIAAVNNPNIIDPTKQKSDIGLAGGFNNATAKAMMKKIEGKIPLAMIEKVANHVYDMNQWKLKNDIKDGKITQATADKFPQYRHYVPLTGDPRTDDSVEDHFATGSVNQAKEKEFKGRTGSLSNNGIDTSFEQLEKSARYHGWNDFKDALAETYDKLIAEKLATGLSQKDAEQAVWDEFDIKRRPETGMVPAGENDITVRKDGKGMIYTINNQAAMEALRSVNNEDTPSVLKPIAAFTRFQARMVTSFMPLFAPNNMLRDVAERSENIRTRKLAGHPNLDMNKVANQAIGNAAKLLAKLKPVMMGVLAENTHLAKVLPMDATNQDVIMLKRFLELGGSSTYGDMLSPDSKSLSEKLRKTGTISDKAMEMIDLYNNAFELISGFSIYKSLVENGVNDKQAATTSLNLMNFRKRGRVMSPLRALYMFAQPIATGGHQMAMTLATRRGQLRYAAYTIAAMALYAMLRSGDDDEELGVNKMDELGNFTLYRNIPIPMGNGQYFKVPVGFGMQQLAWAHGVNAVRTMLGEMTAGEAAAESAALWARSAMPVAPAETAMLKNPMVWFAQTFSPQIAKPLINVALDVNSFGAPLTNARYERQDLAKSLQGRRDTPQLYKDIAQEFGRMGMDIYPEQVREFMRDYGAGAGNEVLKWAVENPAKKERGLSIASPLVDRYVLQTNDDSLKQRLYYRKRDMMNKLSVRKSSGDTLTQREENLVSLGDRLKTLEARARGKAAAAKKAENAGNAAKAQNLRTQYYRMRMDYMTIGIQQG